MAQDGMGAGAHGPPSVPIKAPSQCLIKGVTPGHLLPHTSAMAEHLSFAAAKALVEQAERDRRGMEEFLQMEKRVSCCLSWYFISQPNV